jgi:hypothetical protein
MKRTWDVGDSDLYDASDDLEVNEYNISCILYSCGLDGSTIENLDIDALIDTIDDCYWHKNQDNTTSDSPLSVSAASLVLRRNRSILLTRLRLSYLRMGIAKGVLENE